MIKRKPRKLTNRIHNHERSYRFLAEEEPVARNKQDNPITVLEAKQIASIISGSRKNQTKKENKWITLQLKKN